MSSIFRPDGAEVARFDTVAHMLNSAARHYPEQTAIVCGSDTVNYRQLAKLVEGVAAHIFATGARGRPVAIVLRNSIELAVCICATHRSGAILTTLNPDYTARELNQLIDIANPALIILDTTQYEKLQHTDCPIWCISDNFDDWSSAQIRDVRPLESMPAPTDIATLQFTGGTTGVPKGVLLSHSAVAVNVAQREAWLPTTPGDERVICMMPLFHVFAVSMCLHLAINAGGCIVLLPRYRPELLLDNVKQYAITRLPAGPTVFESLLKFDPLSRDALRSVRSAYSGSAPLPAATLERWQERTGVPVYEGYGQTEAGPVVSYNCPHLPIRAGTVGTALPLTEIEIVGDDGRTLEQGNSGEIRVRGPQLMNGYLDRPGETAEALRDDWLHTGDIGFLDGDGYLSIRDRKNDLVLISGYNVYPREIDDMLTAHPGIAEAAVIGIPDEYRGERLKAFVVRAGGDLTSDMLTEYLQENLVAYKIPSEIAFVDDLPRTTVGKIDRKALQKNCSAGTDT